VVVPVCGMYGTVCIGLTDLDARAVTVKTHKQKARNQQLKYPDVRCPVVEMTRTPSCLG